jgi:hypothetical protein
MASDEFCGAIAHWNHGALHDVVGPMAHHVVITFPAGSQRFERRTGTSVAIGTARPGVVTVIRPVRPRDGTFLSLLMSFISTFRIRHSSALPAKPTRALLAIFWSERRIPTPLHLDC